MMKILKASAGSGKTYNLAKTYLSLLMESEDRYAYRHILAVTFTNKATEEMKSRILKELYILAKTPQESNYYDEFKHIEGMQARAAGLLTDILHDYGAFAISTIDGFFQHTLKSFSHEIGQFSNYQIELDRNSLIHETVDRILDNLTEDSTELVGWLNDSVMEQIEKGRKINIEADLYKMAEMLKDEEVDHTMFTKEKLSGISKECSQIIEDFEHKVVETSVQLRNDFTAGGFSVADTNRGFIKAAFAYGENPESPVKKPTAAFLKNAADSDLWVKKDNKSMIPAMEKAFGGSLSRFTELFEKEFPIYITACKLHDQIYALGIANEFYPEFEALVKEKNVMSLDDSNTILRDIIDGSDAPFIYERLGVRFENFLLDEFQDTSDVQWQNFKPLLAESESAGRKNLIVGDVKQSIYRWRGSDWRLLGDGVMKDFPQAEVQTLQENWRSCRGIMEFNNDFFKYASQLLPDTAKIYADVWQEARSKDAQQGQVKVSFCDEESEPQMVINSVMKAREQGARWGDIAVLVRNNKEGKSLAPVLIARGIPVMSNDALDPKSSITVRRLVSLLSFVGNDSDSLNAFLAKELGVESPASWHSLQDLCESLVRSLWAKDPDCFEREVVYIQAFMDIIGEWSQANGNNLDGFLKYWAGKDFKISSPADSDAVSILSIHSSKGLEFKYVILPYAEKVTLYHGDTRWCSPEGNEMELASESIFPVKLDSWAEDSLFRKDYENEKLMQVIDNLNAFYVAMTRAEKTLHIIACASDPKKGSGFSNLAQVLRAYVGGEDKIIGPDYDFTKMERKASREGNDYLTQYRSYDLDGRLAFSKDASDFFSEDGVLTGAQASARLAGTILHGILSSVEIPSDLDASVRKAASCGLIGEDEAIRYQALLEKRIESATCRGWFPEQRGLAMNERDIADEEGNLHRPDRIVLLEDRTIVIDYKFGGFRPKYVDQVRTYMSLLSRMGYPNPQGFLWFVETDQVTEIKADN